MINEKEAKNIAGQILIEKFGKEYVGENRNRIGVMVESAQGKFRVHFDLFKQDLDVAPIVEKDTGIYVADENFPDRILSIEVNKGNGNAKEIEIKY